MQAQFAQGSTPMAYQGASPTYVTETPIPSYASASPTPVGGWSYQPATQSRLIMGAPMPVQAGTPYVATNSTGHILPQEQPYAFTSVTYAKQPGISAIKQEEFKQQYLNQRSERVTQNASTSRHRVVRKQNHGCCPCC